MGERVSILGIGFMMMSALSPVDGFSQTQSVQNRIPQQIVINGQVANGAHVTTAGGQIQSFTCPSPQHYTSADGSSQGWACYEQTTGVWLLNAVPPAQPQAPAPAPMPAPAPQLAPQQPGVIYQQAPPTVVYTQPPPAVVYTQTQPVVVYQQAPPPVIYQQPAPIIYQPAPTVVYAPSPSPVIMAPLYPSSVVLGRAAIDAAGRIASAAILSSRRSVNYYYYDDRDWKPHRGNNGRRW
jgi:hypothetical protein